MAIFSAIATALGGLRGPAGAGAGAAAGATGAPAAGAGATTLSGVAGTVGAIGGLVGTAMQYKGARDAAEASEKAEALRQTQMGLESARNRRQIIRQAVVARGDALTAATAQGASGGSGLQGGLAQIGAEANTAGVATNQNQALGNQMFTANRQLSRAQTLQSMGSGVSSLAGSLVKNQGAIGRVGAYAVG